MSLVCLAAHQEYPRLQAFVEQSCTRAGCSTRQRLRVILLIEELFTNTVQHGRGGAEPVPVTLNFTLAGKELKVRYEDGARRYDPFQSLNPRHSLEDTVELRPLGGLGVLLIRELGKDVRYAWARNRNCVTFSMPTNASLERKR
jgi:anti-sigma regulatory factor (Ser/Thr protein kinase)